MSCSFSLRIIAKISNISWKPQTWPRQRPQTQTSLSSAKMSVLEEQYISVSSQVDHHVRDLSYHFQSITKFKICSFIYSRKDHFKYSCWWQCAPAIPFLLPETVSNYNKLRVLPDSFYTSLSKCSIRPPYKLRGWHFQTVRGWSDSCQFIVELS